MVEALKGPPVPVPPPAPLIAEHAAIAEHHEVWETDRTELPEPQMIKLTLADGSKVHMNPGAIIYMQALPEANPADKEQPRAKVVLVTGESLLVRQGTGQILVAAGLATPKGAKGREAETPEE